MSTIDGWFFTHSSFVRSVSCHGALQQVAINHTQNYSSAPFSVPIQEFVCLLFRRLLASDPMKNDWLQIAANMERHFLLNRFRSLLINPNR